MWFSTGSTGVCESPLKLNPLVSLFFAWRRPASLSAAQLRTCMGTSQAAKHSVQRVNQAATETSKTMLRNMSSDTVITKTDDVVATIEPHSLLGHLRAGTSHLRAPWM